MVAHAAIGGAQPRVVIVDQGPGPSGQLLAGVLAGPYRLIEPDTAQFILSRDERVTTALVVLGRRRTSIDGHVDGDLVVVGGDIFVHPGAAIGGRAIAIGGAVYSSTLADSLHETLSFRDNTFVVTRSATGYELRYQSLVADATSPLTLPGFYGLRLPSYDRVNGVSLVAGPALTFAGDRGEANALVTYRSDLGRIDPSADVSFQIEPRLRIDGFVGRGTFSNDRWIRSDLVNSFFALVIGADTRNYHRADRAEATVHRLWETTTLRLEPFLGGRGERSWAVGPGIGEDGAPWSIFRRTDTVDGMRRPNPPVPELDIISVLGGADLAWEDGGVRATARAGAERSLHLEGPAVAPGSAFTQLSLDLYVTFLTFGDQQYEIDVHHVTTPEGSPPPQRFAYLGGAGTLPFLDLLEQGGGELLFLDQRYSIPVPRIRLGILGTPTFLLRHRVGGAGLSRLPELEQALSAGVIISVLRGEFVIDPATGDTRGSVAFSFAR
jgi:hypothetical protein